MRNSWKWHRNEAHDCRTYSSHLSFSRKDIQQSHERPTPRSSTSVERSKAGNLSFPGWMYRWGYNHPHTLPMEKYGRPHREPAYQYQPVELYISSQEIPGLLSILRFGILWVFPIKRRYRSRALARIELRAVMPVWEWGHGPTCTGR